MSAVAFFLVRRVGRPSASRPGEQHKIAVRVLHDEVARAPRHELECLEDRDAGGLEFEKE
jgi:hypothetical protein